jgi:hypothetical protein
LFLSLLYFDGRFEVIRQQFLTRVKARNRINRKKEEKKMKESKDKNISEGAGRKLRSVSEGIFLHFLYFSNYDSDFK